MGYLNQVRRYLLLVATLWPLVYSGLFFGDFVPAGLPSFFLHLATIFWLLGLLAISFVDIFRCLLYLRGWERPGAGAPAGLQNR